MSGIAGNKSEDQVLNSVSQVTGIASLRVLAFNPNAAAIKTMLGMPPETEVKEPQYLGLDLNKDGNLQNKIAVYLGRTLEAFNEKKGAKETIKLITRVEFLVKPEVRKNKDGDKTQIVNVKGNTSWATIEDIESLNKWKWFNKGPFHEAIVGEEIMLDFVRNWLNLGSNDDCNFVDFKKIAAGDVTELEGYRKQFPQNEVTVLVGVTTKNDKIYQAVYNKAFSRPTAKTPQLVFANALKGAYGEFKADFQDSFDLKIYQVKVEVSGADKEAGTSASAPKSDFL